MAVNAAAMISAAARSAVSERGRFILALSGGNAPKLMFNTLSREDFPWGETHLFQVDERIAPDGHPDRNLELLRATIFEKTPIARERVYSMPVQEEDLESAAVKYENALRDVAGTPPVLDLIHLGLGTDGHTASLIPGDPALDLVNRDIGVTNIYNGWSRMTMTYPVINRARSILWLVTGAEKSEMLARLMRGDYSIPAGRVRRQSSFVFTDNATANLLNCETF